MGVVLNRIPNNDLVDNRPIGVFDSGAGGLTVVRELQRQLPNEEVVYFGDTARAPFGDKSVDELLQINFEIIEFLISQSIKAIITGCNSSSAVALEEDRRRYAIPIFGLIKPGAMSAVVATRNRKIGVLATVATIRSGAYQRMILEQAPDVEVINVSAPKLVPLIEQGKINSKEMEVAIIEATEQLQMVDTLVLGCTHYPYIKSLISLFMPKETVYIDPAIQTVQLAGHYLKQKNMLRHDPKEQDLFFCSGEENSFINNANQLIPGLVKKVKRIKITSLDMFNLSNVDNVTAVAIV